MSYVDAGYSIVLAILFLYGVSLAVRRRRLTTAAARVAAAAGPSGSTGPTGTGPTGTGPTATTTGSAPGSVAGPS